MIVSMPAYHLINNSIAKHLKIQSYSLYSAERFINNSWRNSHVKTASEAKTQDTGLSRVLVSGFEYNGLDSSWSRAKI